jgi:hypothetical protein
LTLLSFLAAGAASPLADAFRYASDRPARPVRGYF